jgi:hypothetical protein
MELMLLGVWVDDGGEYNAEYRKQQKTGELNFS